MDDPLAVVIISGLLAVAGIIIGALLTQFFASKIKTRELDAAENLKRLELAVGETNNLRGNLERQLVETDDLRVQLHQCREEHLLQKQELIDVRRELAAANNRILILENDNCGLRQDLDHYRGYRGGTGESGPHA